MIINVARKELKSLFASPMGWIILSILMFGFGTLYLQGVNSYFEVMSGPFDPRKELASQSMLGLKFTVPHFFCFL